MTGLAASARSRSRLRSVASHCVLVLASGAALYPVLWVVKMALSPGQNFDSSPSPIPQAISFEHFLAVTTHSDASGGWLFGQQLANSLLVALATTAVGMLLSCTAAYAFSRHRFPGREAGLTAFLLTQIFPGVVMMIPLYILLGR